MPVKPLLVSGANAAFFPLLRDLLASLEACGAAGGVEFGFFDYGMTDEQRTELGALTDRIVAPAAPDWTDRLGWRDESISITVARADIPAHFPGFDTYLWIDADVWAQDRRGVALYLEAARGGAMALSPQLDRAYLQHPQAIKWRHERYSVAFGAEVANVLMRVPQLNAGIFALEAGAPQWAAWADAMRQAFETARDVNPGSQIPLNQAIYTGDLDVHFLPAICNWQCHLALPRWNPATGRLCEPFLPYHDLYLVHLTADSKNETHKIGTVDGATLRTGLTYSEIAALRDGAG